MVEELGCSRGGGQPSPDGGQHLDIIYCHFNDYIEHPEQESGCDEIDQ